ncbi:MAG: DUF2800 domain-containing protein [Pseudohongiellaceae bacterium]
MSFIDRLADALHLGVTEPGPPPPHFSLKELGMTPDDHLPVDFEEELAMDPLETIAHDLQSLAHSPLGASSAYRYLQCPGSVRVSWNIPETSSEWALEGTAAHKMAEQCLLEDLDAWELHGSMIGVEGPGGETDFTIHEATQEMVDGVQMFLDYVRPLGPERPDSAWAAETKVVADSIHPLLRGTCDYSSYHMDSKDLWIVDFKYGAGIPVEAKGNAQGRIYALGAIDDIMLKIASPNGPPVERVHIVIIQPRCHHPDGPIRYETLSIDQLQTWVNQELMPGLDRVRSPEPEFKSGSWCRFCPAKATCPRLTMDVVGPIYAMGEYAQFKPKELQVDDVEAFLGIGERFRILDKAMKSEAVQRMSTGVDIDGFKLVKNKTHRTWKPEAEEAFELLFGEDDDCFEPRKLKSPAQIEKLGSSFKKFAQEWAFSPEGGFTIASNDDKREGISRKAEDIFGTAKTKT